MSFSYENNKFKFCLIKNMISFILRLIQIFQSFQSCNLEKIKRIKIRIDEIIEMFKIPGIKKNWQNANNL